MEGSWEFRMERAKDSSDFYTEFEAGMKKGSSHPDTSIFFLSSAWHGLP